MSNPLIVLVTGANRGIGHAICEQILSQPQPCKLYAASRAGKDLGFKPTKGHETFYPSLDITSSSSISALFDKIKQEDGHLDVLINNAGINTSPDRSPPAMKQTLDTNYRGTLSVCQTFLPLMSKNGEGRIVNVSSVGSSLHIYSSDVASRFRDSSLTLEELENMAKEYEGVVDEGREKETGWAGKGQGYSVSKACVNAFTAILARENQGQVVMNACCPGWVNTDMGALVGKAPKSVYDGAKIPMRLGFADIDGVTGRYWSNPSVYDTGDGEVVDW